MSTRLRLGNAPALALALCLLAPAVGAGQPSAAAALDPSPAAGPEPDRVVLVGADDPGSPQLPAVQDRFEYHAYYPERLQVLRGDVVRFVYAGEHSVTFYPGGIRPDSSFVPDEVEGQVRLDGVFPSRDDCAVGGARANDPQPEDLPPCVLSGPDQLLNLGASSPSLDYLARVRVEAEPGVYPYFCVFHSRMRGEIEVVPDAEAHEMSTRSEVESARRARILADTAAAEAVLAAHRLPDPVRVGDRSRWQVQVGGSTPDGRVALLTFLPPSITVEPGDEVEFVLPPMTNGAEGHSVSFLPEELHTARLPGDLVVEASPLHYYEFRCDQDGRDSGAPGVPGALVTLFATGGCPEGELEMLWLPHAYANPASAPGGLVAGPEPIHDSGAMITPGPCDDSCDPWTGEPLPHRFEARFPDAGEYGYWCFLHARRGMTGSISVTG